MTWLRTGKVLLPGVTTPARLVARVRETENAVREAWPRLAAVTVAMPGGARVLFRQRVDGDE